MSADFASKKIVLIFAMLTGIFAIYPNINSMLWHYKNVDIEYLVFFLFRYLFFCTFTWALLAVNVTKFAALHFRRRLLKTFLVSIAAYSAYVFISLLFATHNDCFTGMLLFQFIVVCLLCTLTGHVFMMYMEQRNRDMEIEQLKTENLQSRYDALLTQISPHFFFNSLNNIAALVRENDSVKTQEYIHKLSGIFRYILQSNKKSMVSLKEEFDFLDDVRYVMNIRFAEKLRFDITADAGRRQRLQIPVLSFLPLIENIVKHNVIDSDNTMTVSIVLNDRNELTVSNPVCEKLEVQDGNGIGLANLSERFLLLTGRKMKVETDEKNAVFRVILPLPE